MENFKIMWERMGSSQFNSILNIIHDILKNITEKDRKKKEIFCHSKTKVMPSHKSAILRTVIV